MTLESQLELEKNAIETKIKDIKDQILSAKTSQKSGELDPTKYYAVTTEKITYDSGNFNFKNIPKGITVEVRSYNKSKGRFFIVRTDNFDSGLQSGKGLTKIGEKDFMLLKNGNNNKVSNNNTCKFLIDEYDPFVKARHLETNPINVLQKSDDSWSKKLNIIFGKKGQNSYIKIQAGSVECINNLSKVELLLDNGKTLRFLHKYNIDCGDNIWITANLTTSEITMLRSSRIKAAKINGIEYYANFLKPLESSLNDVQVGINCIINP